MVIGCEITGEMAQPNVNAGGRSLDTLEAKLSNLKGLMDKGHIMEDDFQQKKTSCFHNCGLLMGLSVGP